MLTSVSKSRTKNAVAQEECEKKINSRVKNPVANVGVCITGFVLGLIPVLLDLGDKAILILLGAFLDGLALLHQIGLELFRRPGRVRTNYLGVPVVLDQVLEILAISRGWVRDTVVR